MVKSHNTVLRRVIKLKLFITGEKENERKATLDSSPDNLTLIKGKVLNNSVL